MQRETLDFVPRPAEPRRGHGKCGAAGDDCNFVNIDAAQDRRADAIVQRIACRKNANPTAT